MVESGGFVWPNGCVVFAAEQMFGYWPKFVWYEDMPIAAELYKNFVNALFWATGNLDVDLAM